MREKEPGVRLHSIHIYPMKAARAVDLDESVVEPWGLVGDRRWLLVDEDGRFVSQREEPSLARVVVSYGPGMITDGQETVSRGPGTISVSASGCPGRQVTARPELLKVTVWGSTVLAAAAGPEGDAWFSAYLGRPVRLVYLDDPTRRAVDPQFGRPGDVVSFADGFPLLLTSSASLGELGCWLTEAGERPVPMTRFRPNAVVTGAPPWAEDRWRRIRIGAVEFRVVKPCGRCVVTTTDQTTGEVTKQPLKMLGRRRRFGQQLVFGQNMIPEARTGHRLRSGSPPSPPAVTGGLTRRRRGRQPSTRHFDPGRLGSSATISRPRSDRIRPNVNPTRSP